MKRQIVENSTTGIYHALMPGASPLASRGKMQNGSYGVIDNLSITYNGNQLSSLTESAAELMYNGSLDYKGAKGSQYKYNENGSLVSDKSRGIAFISYDLNNNPQQIYFTNGNVTKYVYTASGQKLRVIHYTAVPNISRTLGVKPAELTPAQILSTATTDYMLGGSLVLKNGKIDKVLFEGGYAQATSSGAADDFAFNYYNTDHLGNVREVVNAAGTVQQVTNYYPFGATYFDDSAVKASDYQPYKFNGKEFDKMNGLNTYDYGARQHDPILGRWDRIDPLAEKYYPYSPYVYCVNNPIKYIDERGDSVRIIFDKNTQKLFILNMDYYNPNKGLKFVSYEDYKEESENQVLVIPFVFSGGEISDAGSVVVDPNRRELEKELPDGVYDVLDNAPDGNSNHKTWYRLDRVDNSRYDDKDDNSSRSGFRLHLGTISFGCVTINKKQSNSDRMWNVLVNIMSNTKTKSVKENRGRQSLNPLSRRTWYGQMAVIGGK
jgi:RHS repeat-associated protein